MKESGKVRSFQEAWRRTPSGCGTWGAGGLAENSLAINVAIDVAINVAIDVGH